MGFAVENNGISQAARDLSTPTQVQRLAQNPRDTPDTPPHGWQRTLTSTEFWMCGAQGHIQRYCPKRFEDRLRPSSIRSPKERPGNEALSRSRAGARQTPQQKFKFKFNKASYQCTKEKIYTKAQ